ncbi:hypothetical protein [Chryseobacterium sp. FH1]|uniref:hypothetical protein n=1 Tax=Chryseobacterium sp. FH1 TaxID=1233951 RepID=UPI00068F13E9|nr:hypothetical protein [Chryseobacterium sp. FH1]
MSNRIFEDKNGKFGGKAEFVYANPAHIFCEVVDPKDLFIVAGRATGKTTTILARRSIRISKSMPGAYFAFVGDYYSNLLSNTVPTYIDGLKDAGLEEGKHFVLNERPPAHFDQPYKSPLSYKHTISWANGCFEKLVSMDIVSSAAGDSFQHIKGDETKYLDKTKIDKLLPANRGQRMRFEGSTYYRGVTFTTDMPNVLAPNEYDWILDMEANMDTEQIKTVIYASLVVNEIKMALRDAYFKNDRAEYEKQKKSYYRWNERLYRARVGSTCFHVISSFANADILTLDWFQDQLNLSGIEGFKAAILSMKQELKAGEKFYPQFEPKHLYDDGLVSTFYDSTGFGEEKKLNSTGLKYCLTNQHLEGGMDFGKMMSLIIGQKQGWSQRILKNFHRLGKDNIEFLAQDFIEFFQYHKRKHLKLYHDRSGNQNRSFGKDMATLFKKLVEGGEINGIKQGWKVELMSVGQGTIYQFEEYNLVNQMFSEINPALPRILIDKFQCLELISSISLAKIVIDKNKRGETQLNKNKTSESMPLKSLPMFSTNYSDAFKYYFCRPEYMKEAASRLGSSNSYAPIIHSLS